MCLPRIAKFGRGLGRREELLVDLHEDVSVQAFTEADERAVRERTFARKRLHSNKLLEVGGLRHSPDQRAVAQPHPLLDDECPQGHPEGEGGVPLAGREVLLLTGMPRVSWSYSGNL